MNFKPCKAICTTLLIEKSPQALPLGTACIASAIKNHSLTKETWTVDLKAFSIEDKDFLEQAGSLNNQKSKTESGSSEFCNNITYEENLSKEDKAAAFIANELLKLFDDNTQNNPPQLKVCCFSVFVWNRIILQKVSLELQKNGIYCIAGGPEITAHPECFTDFNYVLSGEGEESVPSLLCELFNKQSTDALPSPNDIKTLVVPTSDSPDLEKLNSPYLNGTLNPKEYEGALWELARGCPFKCAYCYESKGQKRVRFFPMERIERELDLFARLKIPQVFVLDPTYNANKERAIKMLNLIAKKTPDTFYYFEARAEFLDAQMVKAFTKIPCALQIGLQSANEETLKLVNRPFNKKQFVKNIGLLNEYGVIFGLDLIYGLPAESLKTFKEGINFALGLYPNNLEIFCLSVLPGTAIFDQAEKLHLTYDKNPPYNIIHTNLFSKEDIAYCKKLANSCTLFYNNGRAVPWFNTICYASKTKPVNLLIAFNDYLQKTYSDINELSTLYTLCEHEKIEELQLNFIKNYFTQKNMGHLVSLAQNIIKFNGALSRTQDTGKPETIMLNYDPEYLSSQYATDLKYFYQNVKPGHYKMQTFKNGHFSDFKTVK